MRFTIRCVRTKQLNEEILLRGGKLYESIKKGDTFEITNETGKTIVLDLKEFSYRCEIVKRID